MPLETCMSPALCRAGLPNRACASCVPDEHRCTGVKLEVCSGDGMGFTSVQDCETAGLCNAMLGRCTSAVCDPNKKSCMGNTLVTCNADGTDFSSDRVQCANGMCDAEGGDCNTCEPGEKRCEDSSAQTCDATGQRFTSSPCSTGHCVGAGLCVACSEDEHCSTLDPCQPARCTTDNRCSTGPAPDGTSCSAFVASGNVCRGGRCVECFEDRHCSAPTGVCDTSRNRCVECQTNSDCSGQETCSLNQCNAPPTSSGAPLIALAGTTCPNGYINGGSADGATWCARRCTADDVLSVCGLDAQCQGGTAHFSVTRTG